MHVQLKRSGRKQFEKGITTRLGRPGIDYSKCSDSQTVQTSDSAPSGAGFAVIDRP